MKFQVTMKDPDTLHDAIEECVKESLKESLTGFTNKEAAAISEVRFEEIQEKCNKWFRWGEYLTVEIDTDAETCVVMSVER